MGSDARHFQRSAAEWQSALESRQRQSKIRRSPNEGSISKNSNQNAHEKESRFSIRHL